jgi:hypothetical protein
MKNKEVKTKVYKGPYNQVLYSNGDTKEMYECNHCGREWEVVPYKCKCGGSKYRNFKYMMINKNLL